MQVQLHWQRLQSLVARGGGSRIMKVIVNCRLELRVFLSIWGISTSVKLKTVKNYTVCVCVRTILHLLGLTADSWCGSSWSIQWWGTKGHSPSYLTILKRRLTWEHQRGHGPWERHSSTPCAVSEEHGWAHGLCAKKRLTRTLSHVKKILPVMFVCFLHKRAELNSVLCCRVLRWRWMT